MVRQNFSYLYIQKWEAHHRNVEAWLMRDVEKVISSEISSKEASTILLEILINQTHLQADGLSIPLKLTNIIVPSEETQPSHLILETTHQIKLIRSVSLQLPKTLGDYHLQVVQPIYRFV
ncbi:MAG: hypothetical protein CL915_12320 [Deltaproteobacteria bacterium]|nr:hypothetical protein [Deltaproteobacteria bacterium]